MKGRGGHLKAKYYLWRQSWPKCLKVTAVFLWNSTLQEKFNFDFWRIFFQYWQNFNFRSKIEHQATIHEVFTSTWYFLISLAFKSLDVRQLVRQLVYVMFITNNRDSFHLWWHENFVKHQNVSKYYGKDCLKNFLLLFMSESAASFLKSSHFCGRNLLHRARKRHTPNFKGFQYQIWTSVKRSEK